MYIDELCKLCREADFDRELALHYIKNTDINREFLRDNLSTVLLNEAIDVRNIPMIELLLENGADAGIVFDNGTDSLLWALKFLGGDNSETNDEYLRIAGLILEYGADANAYLSTEPEPLFDTVVYDVFNDGYYEGRTEYLIRFMILLVAYGASTDYCTPRIVRPFDKSDMGQYRFYFVSAGNGGYSGVIRDRNDLDTAYV